MSMDTVVSCVVVNGCFLWTACSLDKTLLVLSLLHFALQGQIAYYSGYLLTSPFCIPILYDENDIFSFPFFSVLVQGLLLGLQRTGQLKHLWQYCLGHRLELLWYWMACLGNEQRSFCRLWDCTQVLHFGILLTTRPAPFLLRDSCPQY